MRKFTDEDIESIEMLTDDMLRSAKSLIRGAEVMKEFIEDRGFTSKDFGELVDGRPDLGYKNEEFNKIMEKITNGI